MYNLLLFKLLIDSIKCKYLDRFISLCVHTDILYIYIYIYIYILYIIYIAYILKFESY